MSSIMTPGNILTALDSLEGELPSLTGKDAWETIKDEFYTLMSQMRNSNDPEEAIDSRRIWSTFCSHMNMHETV